MKPGPFSTKTVTELFIKGTAPKDTDDFHHAVTIDTASGLLWQDGCVGPKKTVGALDFSSAEAIGKWGYYDRGWQKRASKGSGVRGGPEGHPDRVLLRQRLLPVRQELGRDLRADRALPDPGAAAADLRDPVLPRLPDRLTAAGPADPETREDAETLVARDDGARPVEGKARPSTGANGLARP